MTKIDKPNRRNLRLALTAMLILFVVPLSMDLYSRMKLERAVEGYTYGFLDFEHFKPDPLPEDTVNGTDYEEAASLVIEGQNLTYQPRDGAPDAGFLAVQDVFKRRNLDRSELSAEDLDLFRHQVQRLDLGLRILDKGLETTHEARYQTDWNVSPWDIVIPNLLTRIRFGTLLRARGEIALAEGRWDDAWRDAAKIQRLAHWSAQSLPTLINALVARAISYEGMIFVQKLLAGPPVDRGLYDAVMTEAGRLPSTEHYSMLLDAERSAAFTSLLDPRATSFGVVVVPKGFPLWMSARRWAAADYLNWAGPYFEGCKAPSHALDDKAFEDGLPKILGVRSLADFAFDCRTVSRKRDLAVATLDHLQLALQLTRHHEENGAYPADLSGLQGSTSDPFLAGADYRYELQDDGGYKLWSASYDGVDGGGELPHESESGSYEWETGDFVWWVRGPAPPAESGV